MADKDEARIKIGELENKPIYAGEVHIETSWLDKISKIKGIGLETVNDIKKIYKSETDLINSIKEDSVPLRNDVVEKLRKYYGA